MVGDVSGLTKLIEMSDDSLQTHPLYTTDRDEVDALLGHQGDPGPEHLTTCLLYTSPSPRDGLLARMPSSA